MPALNDLLKPFHISFGDKIFSGDFTDGEAKNRIRFLSGNSIKKFPANGFVKTKKMLNQGKRVLNRGTTSDDVVLFGMIDTNDINGNNNDGKGGRIVVYGDSNCIDSNNARGKDCNWLLKHFLTYTSDKKINEGLKNMVLPLKHELNDKLAGKEPKRRPDCVRQFRKHSKVLLMENSDNIDDGMIVNVHEQRKCNNKIIRL